MAGDLAITSIFGQFEFSKTVEKPQFHHWLTFLFLAFLFLEQTGIAQLHRKCPNDRITTLSFNISKRQHQTQVSAAF
jgi:hypothetical protein